MYPNCAVDMIFTKADTLIESINLGREVTVTLFVPETAEPIHLLLLNDGQEVENLKLAENLEKLCDYNRIAPVAIAAIHAGKDRVQEYGTAGKPDYKKRGSKAQAYTDFILTELLPHLYTELGTSQFESTAFAGFSLGGLTALDIAWHYPNIFNKVGVFSGSLWWRTRDLSDGYTDNDRIMHRIIRESKQRPDLKLFLQTGTQDETADRNQNGIIDSIDDTIDLIIELENKGYTRPEDIHYLEVVGGRHDFDTWSKAFPKFLCWAFKR